MILADEKSFQTFTHLVRSEGEHNSKLMFKFPTDLELKVKQVLEKNNIKFKFQKVLYRPIKGYRHYVEAYYIANFWIPKKKLIINVQKAYRKIAVDSEDLRTHSYDGISPKVQIVELDREAVECPTFEQELVAILK